MRLPIHHDHPHVADVRMRWARLHQRPHRLEEMIRVVPRQVVGRVEPFFPGGGQNVRIQECPGGVGRTVFAIRPAGKQSDA